MEDNVRAGTFRIVHLSEVSAEVATDLTTIEEGGKHFKISWIRDSDGKPEEFTSEADALRAIQDMCGEVHLDGFTQKGQDIPVEEYKQGFRAL